MLLSYVIVTHNRREALLQTLRQLPAVTPLPSDQWQTIVVDNASTDGTAKAVRERIPGVTMLRRQINEGSAARNLGVAQAAGRFIVFLDDDSHPTPGAIERALLLLEARQEVGLVGGRVELPDGSQDGAALPIVMPACALVVRRSAFQSIGGFDPHFFRQAEEYDLIFKMLRAGYDVQRFEDLVFHHQKVATARVPRLILHMDLRNNLVLARRHLPMTLARQFRHDWLRRYAALMLHHGFGDAIGRAASEARRIIAAERFDPWPPMNDRLIERIFGFEAQRRMISQWAGDHGVRHVVIAGLTKNLLATWRGCCEARLRISAVADDHPAYQHMNYRGLPIMPLDRALAAKPDGVVLSNINPAQIDQAEARIRSGFVGPVLRLWTPQYLADRLNPSAEITAQSAGSAA